MKRAPMERNRGGTTAGVLVWTPAPAYSSPSSPEGSDFRWEEEVDEDFQRQMDENGIIGLAESQGQLEVDHREEELGEDMLWDVKTPEPEDGPPPSALGEISFRLSELLDSGPLSQPTENDCHTSYMQEEQVADDDQSVLLEDWTDDEHDARSPMIHRQELHSFPERDGTLDMTDEDTEETDMCEDSQRHADHSFPVTEKMAHHIYPIKGFDFIQNGIEDHIQHVEITERSEQSDSKELKKCFPSTSHLSSPKTLHAYPYLSFEEQMDNCGIDAETFSEGALSNITVESSHSTSTHQRFEPKAYQTIQFRELESKHKNTPQTSVRSPLIRLGKTDHAGMSEDNGERRLHSPCHNHQLPKPSPSKTNPDFQDCQVSSRTQSIAKARKCSPPPAPHRSSDKNNQRTSKTSHTDPVDVRKGQLSHPLPDFSKVGPKVHFPKDGYKPPKSRTVAHGKTSQAILPVVFKSPAEIVREVLLSSTDESPGSPFSGGTHKHLNSTVPEEFRCPQQTSTLVQQLQEDYNRLLTKYAEAENTIDRLRLKAKVSLYSDPPKPSTAILSGVIQEGSKVMTLTFPQAQRAEFGAGSANPTGQRDHLAHIVENSRKGQTRPSSANSVSSRGSVSITADHLTETLTNQTYRFQLQVDSFEELLKNGKLKPCEQLKGVSTLAEGQESLERAYLDTRAQFRVLQQRQGRPLTFDPNRELEGQIFTSGMRLEELKERVKQNQTTLEPPATPPPHWDMLSLSMLETEPLPESPLSAAHPEACVGAEVSSVSGESDEEEMLPSHLYPLNDKHQYVEKDFGKLMDRYQSFKELPGLLDRSVTLMGFDSLDFEHSSPSRNESYTNRQQQWSTTDREKRQPVADCGPPSGPSARSQVRDAMETHPKAPWHSSVLPGQPGRETKTAGNRKVLSSSMTSLAETIETGNIILKTKSKTAVAPPLDGVVSPETDSGFMGSESSQLTPAVHSPLQQRAVVRSSGPHMKNSIKANSACRTRQVSSSPSRLSLDPPADNHTTEGCTSSVGRRAREERCSASCLATSTSPLHWPETTLQPGPRGLTSQSEHGSDQEEKAQDNPYPQPANLQSDFHRSPCLPVPYHRSDLKAQSSVQLTNHQEALQSLQEEVNKLKERLEGSLSLSKPSSPVIAPPNISDCTRDNTSPHAASPPWLDLRSSERMRGQRERRSREMEEKVRSGAPRPSQGKRSASLPRYRSESNTTSDSEHVQSEPRASAISYVPVSPVTSRGRRQTRSGFGRHQNSHQTSTPEAESEDSGDTEPSQVPQPICARCASKRIGAPARPARSTSFPCPAQSHCSHCAFCGALQSSQSRIPQPENQGSVPRWSQPMRALQRERVGVNMAVAPPPTGVGSVPVVPYMPVYPSTLYISSPVTAQGYSQPFKISMSPSRDESSEVRGHRRRSLSMDHQQSSLSGSLTHAITVARNMRRVSRHMAHSMASGLENMSVFATTY
ncbi:microtubule organization protein AKNA isoform X2 [Triplophysa dalaica]|uniref:microtubule organization protein AKNA isoform X2 n=1 Tax=Triplophysa dalaica TaxID=1582913 RepID=UPI0024DFFCAA|nr:microtubule organization protein AKNA isoform X2 [Triplophysa dalaica]